MRQRPIKDLLDALSGLGVKAASELANGCPPVVIESQGLPGGTAVVRGNTSSQFLSGLLLAAPLAQTDLTIRVEGPLVSKPYVAMTRSVMRAFGVEVATAGENEYHVPCRTIYRGSEYTIEPDASAASYFWAAAAITGGSVTVRGLSRRSLQGDVAFVECLAKMGCQVEWGDDEIGVAGGSLRGIDVDMNAISDTVQSLAVVALFADGATTIRGVHHIRHKETDRIGDLAREIRKFGAKVEEHADGMVITPPPHGPQSPGQSLATYQDHRMAMSLALAGLRLEGVTIEDPKCTAKTYPRFWTDLQNLVANS